MATANPDHNHQRQTVDENGEIVTQQVDPGESAPSEPMPNWAWEEETATE